MNGPNPPGTASVILIIDDDPTTIWHLRGILKTEGRVIFANNGRDGLTLARDRNPDLILLDAEMPDMDGFEVCAALQASRETATIPVIFVTALNDMANEVKALNLGAVDFITKPISPPIVTVRVRTHLTLRRREEELRRLSRTDSLTGIANRRVLDEMLETEWTRASRTRTPIGFLMIDVDQFKRYNDHYGHAMGDTCLKTVVGAITGVVRDPPDLVARFGGEEFACLLPGADADGTASVGRRILEVVRRCGLDHAFSDVAAHITVSIGGVAREFDAELSPGLLVEAADRHLYQAKSEGRNRLVMG